MFGATGNTCVCFPTMERSPSSVLVQPRDGSLWGRIFWHLVGPEQIPFLLEILFASRDFFSPSKFPKNQQSVPDRENHLMKNKILQNVQNIIVNVIQLFSTQFHKAQPHSALIAATVALTRRHRRMTVKIFSPNPFLLSNTPF